MKQETSDKTYPTKTQEKSSEIKVLSIKYFYNLFIKKRSSRKKKISFLDFRKIVTNYLSVYFHELYYKGGPLYFFFGGKMKLVTYKSWVKIQNRVNSNKPVLHRINKPIGLFWYLRPSMRLFFMVKIKKLTGKKNRLPKIEAIFNNNNDKDLLPIFTEEQKKGKIDKTLYKCIQT